MTKDEILYLHGYKFGQEWVASGKPAPADAPYRFTDSVLEGFLDALKEALDKCQ